MQQDLKKQIEECEDEDQAELLEPELRLHEKKIK